MKQKYAQLTQRQQQALSYLSKDELAFTEFVGLLRDEVARESALFEKAKDHLVVSGDGRPACLRLMGRLEVLNELIALLDSSRDY